MHEVRCLYETTSAAIARIHNCEKFIEMSCEDTGSSYYILEQGAAEMIFRALTKNTTHDGLRRNKSHEAKCKRECLRWDIHDEDGRRSSFVVARCVGKGDDERVDQESSAAEESIVDALQYRQFSSQQGSHGQEVVKMSDRSKKYISMIEECRGLQPPSMS